jgi:5-methylcytosine-specific restriction endonuclease McrA
MKPPRRRSTGQLNHRRWRRLRDQVVREEPICRLRIPGVCTLVSTTGDHILPVRYRPDLKFERRNVQGSCRACNHKKGAKTPAQVAEMRRHRPRAKALDFFS